MGNRAALEVLEELFEAGQIGVQECQRRDGADLHGIGRLFAAATVRNTPDVWALIAPETPVYAACIAPASQFHLLAGSRDSMSANVKFDCSFQHL